MLCIEVDGFRKISRTFGQAAGDELLGVVGERLSRATRGTGTVGRLGGDEFAVLIDPSARGTSPQLVAACLLDVLHQPIALAAANGRPLLITASIGIACAENSGVAELLRDADLALYHAKLAGTNRYAIFEPGMQTAMYDRLVLEMDLGEALEGGQLFLLYQPIFELASRRIAAVEALIRWRHPQLGIIAPGAFIPIAEETGMVVPLGRWALEEACRQGAAWHARNERLRMFVNVSARQLERDEFINEVRRALSMSRLDPAKLTLEITETTLMRGAESARRVASLKSLGVGVAIDDFGTGYSSFASLHEFPVDVIKIDRSFVSGSAASRERSSALIHSLVQLGKTLGITTVAEGIEDDAALQRLVREQCDLGQGFFLARPAEAATIEGLITTARATPHSYATSKTTWDSARRGQLAMAQPVPSVAQRRARAGRVQGGRHPIVPTLRHPGRRVLCEAHPTRH